MTNPLALLHLAFFGIYLPYVVVRGFLRRRKQVSVLDLRPRLPGWKHATKDAAIKGLTSATTAFFVGVPILPAAWPSWPAVAIAVAACGAMFGIEALMIRDGVLRGARFVHLQLPESVEERWWWCGLSVAAGICEEITWRGVQLQLLAQLTGSYWVAVAICSLTFGLGHLWSGWRGVASTMLFALMFHVLVWVSGSLYLAMAVHIAVDLFAGFYTVRTARLLGYRAVPEVSPTPPTIG